MSQKKGKSEISSYYPCLNHLTTGKTASATQDSLPEVVPEYYRRALEGNKELPTNLLPEIAEERSQTEVKVPRTIIPVKN